MKIGKLATATQTPTPTIRFYEREGLMPAAARSEGNYRHYGAAHVQRLALIRRCRALDMSLDEVRALLRLWDEPSAPCEGVSQLLDTHLAHVQLRLDELQTLHTELLGLRARCQAPTLTSACDILRTLAQGEAAPTGATTSHSHLDRTHGRHRR